MFEIIKFIQKRPSDKNIKIWRIIFWLILTLWLYYNLIFQGDSLETNFFWKELSTETLNYIKYGFIATWIIPLIMWVVNICLLPKKYMRFLQIFFAIILFFISGKILAWDDLDIETLIWIMAILPLLAWITWKCITSNCMKYMEKINKIRI